jgi:hypothetical protein
MSNRIELLFQAGLAVLLASCTTVPREIETPTGPVATGDVNGPFEVLGVSNRVTTTGNLPTAPTIFEEAADFDVPYGTEVVVPSLTGWRLAYGRFDPEDMNVPQTWSPEDHHWGLGWVKVYVDRLYAPDPITHTQKARLKIQLWLTDGDGNERTSAAIAYNVLYLGHSTTPPPPDR